MLGSRAPDPEEQRILAEVHDSLSRHVERAGTPLDREVLAALAEALPDIEIMAGTGTVMGRVGGLGDSVYLDERVFADWSQPGHKGAAARLRLLSIYYHEGVHLTQSLTQFLFALEEAEVEAYRACHRLQADYLRAVLGRQPWEHDLGLSQFRPEDVLQGYLWLHNSSGIERVGPRCGGWPTTIGLAEQEQPVVDEHQTWFAYAMPPRLVEVEMSRALTAWWGPWSSTRSCRRSA